MTSKHYMIYKNTNDDMCYIDYKKLDGFKVRPTNHFSSEEITVNKLVLIKPSFIDKVLKRKTKKKLDEYLKIIISLMEDDDEGTNLSEALNELSKYSRLVQNTYRKYLDERYIELLLTKISLLEQELKNRIIYAPEIEDMQVGKRR